MDCFCLRKKNAYDFSSPYSMASAGTYRTSVVEDSSSSKNGHVQIVEKNENHHDSVISEENHTTKGMTLKEQNTKNDLQNEIEKDSDSHKDSNEDDDLHDVNRNHESQQNPQIVVEEVTEVSQVNMTLKDEGQKRVSQVSVSSDNESETNGVHEDGHSESEDTKDEGHSDIVQGHSEGHTSDDLNQSSSNKDHISYEEEQNVRNSSFSDDLPHEGKVESDNDQQQDHTPSYDVTGATEDVPKDVVHMY